MFIETPKPTGTSDATSGSANDQDQQDNAAQAKSDNDDAPYRITDWASL